MSSTTRSDLVDQLASSYLEIPVKVFWEGGPLFGMMDTFEHARLEFAGVATAWLNLQRVIWHAEEVRVVPGFPATIRVTNPRVEIAVGQAELDRWLKRFEIPFRLELSDHGLIVHTEIAGFPVAEFQTELKVVGGWFVLTPQRASLLGMPGFVPPLLRTYLPLPPLAENVRLAAIEHEAGKISLTFAGEDFEEDVTPGLLIRVQRRLLPMLENDLSRFLDSNSPFRPTPPPD